MSHYIDFILTMVGFVMSLHSVRNPNVTTLKSSMPFLMGMLGWATFGSLSLLSIMDISVIVPRGKVYEVWPYTFARIFLLGGWLLMCKNILNCLTNSQYSKDFK